MAKKKLPVNGKMIGEVAKILDIIPDTTRVIGEAVHAVVPLVDKVLEQNYEKKNRLLRLPNLIDMNVQEAQEHLESLGFTVSKILAKPQQTYAKKRADEIVAMVPKSGNFEPGTLVKLYYVTPEIIEASDLSIPLPNLIGLSLDEAQEHVTKIGLKPIGIPLKAQAKYAHQQANLILDMQPKPNMLVTSVAKGSLVKLYYLTEEGLQTSKLLAQTANSKALSLPRFVQQVPKLLPKRKKR
ncbi:PASTA domain-containing protein [Streptococcus sp. zg-86]|uniref:PASTA domain-containing protein n=1 Tax=Streptococcus zhangguiae TaxID=2664091 RepID=A0A6I4R6T3_9STRE|nr:MULTISPECIES: PASTA domain-containing protein [unclassified Streptococcus]MTB63516.1 PASTA domain-containing protein [Streptococcus sp. zg-86]MTB89835.1 PASTA domain-containing protein [Streptococcus sp. zg-36]MWV55506.1 PASTA domain-containing protein [Streptococcus sp. zg-70]QTH47696.1 PASTA domain-containing protein [Streptococcus sp. zg-86]